MSCVSQTARTVLRLDHHIHAAHELREFRFTIVISLDAFSSRAVKNLHLRSLKTPTRQL